jgi:hypothetical protein
VINVSDCTVPEKILLAAYQLEQQGQSPFSAEALIVASWQKFPKSFGLKGFAELYPDSNKVLSSIMGEKGLARRGWLAKEGQKLYSLSREGKQAVRALLQEEEAPPAPVRTSVHKGKLSREQERLLVSMLESSGLEKFQQGLKLDLTFADACRFWGISEGLKGEALDDRIDHVREELVDLRRLVGDKGVDLSSGRHIGPEDLGLIQEVDEYLTERFGRHLTLLRARADR